MNVEMIEQKYKVCNFDVMLLVHQMSFFQVQAMFS